ncbi:MAG: acetyl-CoA carboxylase carboxyltransferase subunit alpha [Armatimonadota bacterium]
MSASIEDFERAISELEAQIELVKRLTREQGVDRAAEVRELEEQKDRLLGERYSNLTSWDKTRVARNPKRPLTLDWIRLMFQEFTELHGDRSFADDGAIVGGLARLGDRWVTVVGHQKGRDAAERHQRNFGYAKPEGYRKALRLMRLSEKFGRPIVCLVDTPAADPSVPSEERGISEAIARNIRDMFLLKVPVVVAITGEGGSGGALGIAVGDRILMLEHAIYSVIPPEGCASILWRDPNRGADAAEALKLTAGHALKMGAVHEIVPEPLGGAHRDYDAAARTLRESLERHLGELEGLETRALLDARYRHFRKLGVFDER